MGLVWTAARTEDSQTDVVLKSDNLLEFQNELSLDLKYNDDHYTLKQTVDTWL